MIRQYRSGDLDRVWELYKNYSPDKAPFWQVKEVINKGKTMVFSEPHSRGEVIQGFIISLIDENNPWIWSVVTNRLSRNQGIGTSLLKEIEAEYKGYKRLCLYVSPDNPAQKIYFDLGYRVVEIVPEIYGKNSALKMVKNIG